MTLSGVDFHKGHGTQNDFVLIDDDLGGLTLTGDQVAELADRRRGLGADGVIRVVPTARSGVAEVAAQAGEAEWFMDYSNADGSVSEMCGNGVRVFAHHLVTSGRVPSDAPVVPVATRAGIKYVHPVTNPYPDTGDTAPWYRIDMGQWQLPGPLNNGADALVTTAGIEVSRPGLSVLTGNPHTVVALASAEELQAAELSSPPEVEPRPVAGSNVELIVMEPEDTEAGHGAISMRVHERGVGETRSCGTGACAAAIAASFWGGPQSPRVWRVDVPGGTLQITVEPTGVDHGTVTLAGPAELVATGRLL